MDPTDATSRSDGRYQRIIENIKQLPALPLIVNKLIKVVNSPDSSAEDAADLIEKDPALTTKVLRLANSAFYGMPRSISSVSSAVVILGFNTLRSLVLGASVISMFPSNGAKIAFDRLRFWKHSIVCAMVARSIAQHIMGVTIMDPQSAFCAGIMHDIGKLIFELFTPQEYTAVCRQSQEKGIPVVEAEAAVMGITHAQIGAILADKWALPLELEAAIVHHHEPQAAKNVRELITTIHLADGIAHHLDCGLWDEEALPAEWAGARTLLSIDDQEYQRITASLKNEIDKYKEFFSIISAS
jgi:putative nucleotidyltransferase with HDIG domain